MKREPKETGSLNREASTSSRKSALDYARQGKVPQAVEICLSEKIDIPPQILELQKEEQNLPPDLLSSLKQEGTNLLEQGDVQKGANFLFIAGDADNLCSWGKKFRGQYSELNAQMYLTKSKSGSGTPQLEELQQRVEELREYAAQCFSLWAKLRCKE